MRSITTEKIDISGPWTFGESDFLPLGPEVRLATPAELCSFMDNAVAGGNGRGLIDREFGPSTVVQVEDGALLLSGERTDKVPTVRATTRKDGKAFYTGPAF